MAEKQLRTIEFRGLGTTYTIPEVDPTSSVTGNAADAKVVGDHIKDKENPHGVTIEQIGAAPASHATDKNNPHNITIEQIGAAPATIVSKSITVTDESALNSALTEIINTMANDTAKFLVVSPTSSALFGGKGMFCELYRRTASYAVAKFTGYGTTTPDVLYKTLWNDTWASLTDASPSAFAPSGHGLGWAASLNTYNGGDLDTLTAPGWYFWDSKDTSTTIAGISSQYWYVHVVAYGDGHLHCRQEIHPTTRNTCSPIVRKCSGGTWGEWAWESPPMNVGVEYRTTMYDNGKALYLQRGDNGAIFYRRHGEDAWYAMASRIDGTFANVVAANPTAQNPATRQLRNSTIVSTETTPSYNGEICWVYE